MRIDIAAGSFLPIYRQIVDQVRLAVANGVLKEGDLLPSVRALAEQIVVNPNTVAHAYTELVREGVVTSQAGRGMFIAARRSVFTDEERLRRLEPLLDALVTEGTAMRFSREELVELFENRLDKLQIHKKEEAS